MKYQDQALNLTVDQRKTLNAKALYLVSSKKAAGSEITPEEIYNAYTGKGGLHGLSRKDYDSYQEYSRAKKDAEDGQFFTPPAYCRMILSSLGLTTEDRIADLTCGMGNFINFCPSEEKFYGCEMDEDACKIARFLYPKAHLEHQDIREYCPGVFFDCVVGNPPFNLSWEYGDKKVSSQLGYCLIAAEMLVPLGILAVIVPESFLADSFMDQDAIRLMEERYSFLCQADLPETMFSGYGVEKFAVKLQFWQKKSKRVKLPESSYTQESVRTIREDSDLKKEACLLYENFLRPARERQKRNRTSIFLETADPGDPFIYQTQKYLYQIKIHPATRKRYVECVAYLQQFKKQKKPPGMEYQEWEKKKIKKEDVLACLKQILKSQNCNPIKERQEIIKRDFGLYQPDCRINGGQYHPFYHMVFKHQTDLFPPYEKLLRKKCREYDCQSAPFAEMKEEEQISKWLRAFTLFDRTKMEWIRLNKIQRHDINLMLQKKYGMLQWEQGSGKTLAGIAIGLYRMEQQYMHSTWVVSSAISIKNNWMLVLPSYGLSHRFVRKLKDLQKVRPGDFVLLTLNTVVKYKKQIQRWVRQHGQKIQLVLDESDEIVNPDSQRTKAVLACFRRCRAKLLTTGTSTRNNIREFVPQLELLYNNSVNMLSWPITLYKYSKNRDGEPGLSESDNPYYGMPIPAYKKGYKLFAESHLPCKITVFGQEQWTQDIYNADVLREILDKTVITRTFAEVSGKDIENIRQYTIRLAPEERAVYQKAMDEFNSMWERYFTSTGNDRKDSMMKLIQQIVLLLRISAAPDTVEEYKGDIPVKVMTAVELAAGWEDEIVAVGVRHKAVLKSYEKAIRMFLPERPLFVVTGEMSFAQRRNLKEILHESRNGILLCTQQSLPSSVNFEFVDKVIIPELHYNNAQMSQFYFRFIRYTSENQKEIYFITYAGTLESNLMQMILAKEKLNRFMKGEDADMDSVYEKFGVDYDLMSLLMRKEEDEEGRLCIRWGKQEIVS